MPLLKTNWVLNKQILNQFHKILFLQANLFKTVVAAVCSISRRHPSATHKKWFLWRKASYTVEASMTLPIFVFLCACVLLFFRILTVEWGVAVALNETAREVAVASGSLSNAEKEAREKEGSKEEDSAASESQSDEKWKTVAVDLAKIRILMHKTPVSVVHFGIVGFDFSQSKVDEKDVDLVVSYKVPLPVSFFGIRSVAVSQRAKAHRWVGFDPKEGEEAEDASDCVYVTETGSAYHKDASCSYLNPSIRPVSLAAVESERNQSGHKYYPCPLCRGYAGTVYITSYGENYHTKLGCSGLKRTIRVTTEEKAKRSGYHACSKCAR